MPSVLLLTDRPSFESRWSSACAAVGLTTESQPASRSAQAIGASDCVVFDGESATFADRALLTYVGLARSHGAIVAAALPQSAGRDDLLLDLCGGLIARSELEIEPVARALQRRALPDRDPCFAHVAAAPGGPQLLAIFNDGSVLRLARPLSSDDEGGDVEHASISDDQRSVTVRLLGGRELVLHIDEVLKRSSLEGDADARIAGGLGDVDGVRLGQRLRALRLAAGLTQAELARRTGIHRPNIARVEAGRHTPSLETLARLAAAIGISTTRVLAD